ncbi:Glycosyl transferase family 2 [Paenibacillus sp. UNCCL117]|uniref:glycosyltransferase family 2 protein n=1 Tax=unclassified Paenibacillus TaxID=185978 RepID=UPI00088879EB|nr:MULTISPECIES: glycosyltransferase family 2 protein [unclassified Paenibacillus]SDC93796.1 Glycosyl transferase family 2 [Paenibacillus sp. cl123]SFW29642.1 Glycosyl transferase family 2 [Paenibacillus sp. UNCCL117]
MPDVGVVMPVYIQRADYLAAAVQSIRNQTYEQYRLVIVIDGAPDMERLCRELAGDDPRVEFIVNESNLGVAKTLNRGFKPLLEDPDIRYVTWASSDNFYAPDFIRVLRHALVKGPDSLGLVYSSYRSIDGRGEVAHTEQEFACQRLFQGQPKEALLQGNTIGASFMYKACYARQLDGYRMEPVEDYDYWLRLTELCETRFIPVDLADYRSLSDHSISSTLRSAEKRRGWRYAFHLARHEARTRRGIPAQVAFLFVLTEASEAPANRLEKVYDQQYSNYRVYALDHTEDFRYGKELAEIKHPTFEARWFPHVPVKAALLATLRHIRSPYTMLLGPETFVSTLDLSVLVQQMDRADAVAVASYYTADRLVSYRQTYDDSRPHAHELFRTDAFVRLLGKWDEE